MLENALGGSPNEIQLLSGKDILPDTTTVSEVGGADPTTALRALAWYSEPESTMQWLEPGALIDMDASSPASSDASIDFILQTEWPSEAEPQEARQLPPPLLMQGKNRQKRVDCLCSDKEKKDLQEGSAFKFTVMAHIMLSQHLHQRTCCVPVSPDMKVCDLMERLTEQWLGSPPDELVLTVGGEEADSDQPLDRYRNGNEAMMVAIAWYKHARNADLPSKTRYHR